MYTINTDTHTHTHTHTNTFQGETARINAILVYEAMPWQRLGEYH
jgi:hypothetical protein